MKKLFRLIELVADASYGLAVILILLELKGTTPNLFMLIQACMMIVGVSPVIWLAILVRRKHKWLKPVSWSTLGFGVSTVVTFYSSARVLIYLHRNGSSPFTMDVVLPVLMISMSGLSLILGICWYYNRSS